MRRACVWLSLLCSLLVSSCGGGGGGTSMATGGGAGGGGGGMGGGGSLSVTVTPGGTRSLDQNQTLGVTAQVMNDSSNSGVSWSLSGPGSLSNPTMMTATYVAPTSGATMVTASVTATSRANSAISASVVIQVFPPPTVAASSPLPGGTAGSPYSSSPIANVNGGAGPYSWTVASGALPAGLSLVSKQSSAILQGTPTAPGTSLFTVQATDAAAMSAASPQLS